MDIPSFFAFLIPSLIPNVAVTCPNPFSPETFINELFWNVTLGDLLGIILPPLILSKYLGIKFTPWLSIPFKLVSINDSITNLASPLLTPTSVNNWTPISNIFLWFILLINQTPYFNFCYF